MGNDMNQWIGIGRLTKDAELKYLSSGMAVCKTSIAIGKKYKKNEEMVEETSFVDITIWGKTAEALTPYLLKGKQVAIQGELKQSRWEKDGQNHSKIEINVQNVQLLGTMDKKDNSQKPAAPSYFPDATPSDFPGDIPF